MKMKGAVVAFLAVVAIAPSIFASDDSATLFLKKEYHCRHGTLSLEASAEILWRSEQPLNIEGWKTSEGPLLIAANVDVFNDRGQKVAWIPATDPAPAFLTNTSVKQGEHRIFRLTTSSWFVIKHSGTYHAAGTLRGTAIGGKPVTIELPRTNFHVSMQENTTSARQ